MCNNQLRTGETFLPPISNSTLQTRSIRNRSPSRVITRVCDHRSLNRRHACLAGKRLPAETMCDVDRSDFFSALARPKALSKPPTRAPGCQCSQRDQLHVPLRCWRSFCARQSGVSRLDTDGWEAHPRTIEKIMPAIPIERKLIEHCRAIASPRNEKPRRGLCTEWVGGTRTHNQRLQQAMAASRVLV
jgi:hypothetical protein